MIGLGQAKKAGIGIAVAVGAVLVIQGYVDSPKSSSDTTTNSAHYSNTITEKAHVDSGVSLTRRAGPSTSSARLGELAPGADVTVRCSTSGQSVSGDTTWYQLSDGSYVSARYILDVGTTKHC
jgi:hypothetical protein